MDRTQHSTLNILEASDLLKVHPNTVLKMITSGEIPAAKVGRAWVMLKKDVLDYIENMIIRQTAERMRKPTTSVLPILSRASSRNGRAS